MIQKTFATLRLVALGVAVLCGSAAAQVTPIPGSGCPGAPIPQFVGSTSIGQAIGVICPQSPPPNIDFVVLGVAGRAIVFNPPLACVQRCVLACDPLDIITGSAWRSQIPNDRSLIGVCICVQCGTVQMNAIGRGCLLLSVALQICITP